jgi:hypothetical protein
MGSPDYSVSVALRARRDQIEEALSDLYERTQRLLDENRDKVLELASVLEDKKTISGDEVAEIMGSVPGEQMMREPVGWQSVTEEVGAKRREQALARRLVGANGHAEVESTNGHVAKEDPKAEESEPVEAES